MTAFAMLSSSGVQSDVLRVLLLLDYGTRMVVVSTALLGLAAGLIGTFMTVKNRVTIGTSCTLKIAPQTS